MYENDGRLFSALSNGLVSMAKINCAGHLETFIDKDTSHFLERVDKQLTLNNLFSNQTNHRRLAVSYFEEQSRRSEFNTIVERVIS